MLHRLREEPNVTFFCISGQCVTFPSGDNCCFSQSRQISLGFQRFIFILMNITDLVIVNFRLIMEENHIIGP